LEEESITELASGGKEDLSGETGRKAGEMADLEKLVESSNGKEKKDSPKGK